jgi:hypothetical protein
VASKTHDCTTRCPNCGNTCEHSTMQHHDQPHPAHQHEWKNDKNDWQYHIWRAPSMKQQKEKVPA